MAADALRGVGAVPSSAAMTPTTSRSRPRQAEPTDPLTGAMARDPHLTVVGLGDGRDALVGVLRYRLTCTP
jgi:hypothetical protein